MRKLSMKRKSKSGDTNSDTLSENKEDQKSEEKSEDDVESPKKSKKGKKARADESNGTDKKAKNNKDEDGDEEQYEVEAVLDDKMVRGVKNFLIRWKGYDEDGDTWEPESTLNCPDLLAKYLESKDGKEESGKKGTKKASRKKKTNDEGGEEKPDGEYEVDKIHDVHFKRNGKREFLVHWKGYSATDNTWEPEENMNCPDLIEKFMVKVNKARESDTRELRVNRTPTNRFTLAMVQSGRRLSRRNLGKQRAQYYDNE